jgi:hypothetical protein
MGMRNVRELHGFPHGPKNAERETIARIATGGPKKGFSERWDSELEIEDPFKINDALWFHFSLSRGR